MTIPEILEKLEPYNGRFPHAAMEAAIQQRAAITPELLRVVEAVAEDPAKYAERENHMLHLFSLYLLAQFREKRAYLPIVKLLSAPSQTVDDLIGDTITEGLNQILASVYDGNPGPLQALVENEAVDKFVRGATLEAFLILHFSGQMPRDEVVEYFRSLFHGKLKREPAYVWDGLICSVADLPAPELLEEVRWAYAEGLADPTVAGLANIEEDLVNPKAWRREKLTVITDAIAEMDWWAAFDPDEPWPRVSPEPALLPRFENPAPRLSGPPEAYDYKPPQPIRREQPKIGRNDPCPCNSGKKYKKCCGKG